MLEVRGGINARPVSRQSDQSGGLRSGNHRRFRQSRARPRVSILTRRLIGYANSGIGNVGPEHRANPEHDFNATVTWSHGKHNIRFGGEYLYENRLETNHYETVQLQRHANLPHQRFRPLRLRQQSGQCARFHAARSPFGAHRERAAVRRSARRASLRSASSSRMNGTCCLTSLSISACATTTIPPSTCSTPTAKPSTRSNLPAGVHHRCRARPRLTTTGCATPQAPPCVPGGLNSANPAFQVTVGGVTYNTLNNIVFSNNQPALKAIKDNIGPRIGVAWQLPAQYRAARRLWHLLRPHQLSQPVRRKHAAGLHLALDARRLRHAQHRAHGHGRHAHRRPHLHQSHRLRPVRRLRHFVNSPVSRAATPSWSRPRRGVPPSAATPTTRTTPIRARSNGTSRSSASCRPPAWCPSAYVGSHTQRLEWCCKANYPQGGPFCQNNANARFHLPLHAVHPGADQPAPNTCRSPRRAGITRSPPASPPSMRSRRSSRSASRTDYKPWSHSHGRNAWAIPTATSTPKTVGGRALRILLQQRISRRASAPSTCRRSSTGAPFTSCPSVMEKHWLTHGVALQGARQLGYQLLVHRPLRPGLQPELGRRQHASARSTTTANCVPVSIAGVAPTGTDPANLSNAGGSITGYSRPSVLSGCNSTRQPKSFAVV